MFEAVAVLGFVKVQVFVGHATSFCFKIRPQPPPSFRDGPKDQTRNLEIPGSMLTHRPGMTGDDSDTPPTMDVDNYN
jgi:hypothetical protein